MVPRQTETDILPLKKKRIFPSGRSQKLEFLVFERPNSTKRCIDRGLSVTQLSKHILPMRMLSICVVKPKQNHHPLSAAIMNFCYQMICLNWFCDSSQLSTKPMEYYEN